MLGWIIAYFGELSNNLVSREKETRIIKTVNFTVTSLKNEKVGTLSEKDKAENLSFCHFLSQGAFHSRKSSQV